MTMVSESQDVHMPQPADLSEQLGNLLTRQIHLARQGKVVEVERLTPQVDALVAQMASVSTDRPALEASQKDRLMEQYEELTLTLQAQRADVQARLKQVREVKRTISAYNSKRRR